MAEFNDHKRVNDILLGPLERPALKWLAAHMPAWVTPDICTTIGFLAALGIAISYILSSFNKNFLWLASLFFIINWFGDSLDGTLARHRHIERPVFGFFLDHTIDAVNEIMILLGMGLTPFINFNVACLTLVAYLLLSVLVYIRTYLFGEFKISYSKLGPTEVRVLTIILNTWMYFGGQQTMIKIPAGIVREIVISPYDLYVGFICFLLLYFFTTTAIRETIRLYKLNA